VLGWMGSAVKIQSKLEIRSGHGHVSLRRGDDGALAALALLPADGEIHGDDELGTLRFDLDVLHDLLDLSLRGVACCFAGVTGWETFNPIPWLRYSLGSQKPCQLAWLVRCVLRLHPRRSGDGCSADCA